MKINNQHHPGVIRVGNTFNVPGIGSVDAAPFRRPQEARQLALRIATQPKAVLAVCRMLNVHGVRDERFGPAAGAFRLSA